MQFALQWAASACWQAEAMCGQGIIAQKTGVRVGKTENALHDLPLAWHSAVSIAGHMSKHLKIRQTEICV